MLRVAVVGSGPAGLYTAEALVKQAAALTVPVALTVDVLDRLPTPYGLVRYGVAPDHKSIKSVANYLRRVLESPDVRFLGGVHFGDHVTREDLLDAYDAVVYATGAMRDRRMAIPGEDLPGSCAATDFVNWYCGHPDVDPFAFTLDAESVAVIGVGNVAVDVARILARDPAELEGTDVPEPVLAALRASKVREVHMIGRRGPAQAKFTTKELRELGELPGVAVSTEPAEMDLGGFDASGESAALAENDRRVRGNLVALRAWEGAPAGAGRTLRIRFWLRPLEILESSSGTVSSLRLERTRLTSDGVFEGTGETELLDAQMVLRSVGYQSVPLAGVPFDPRSHTVPNAGGRVLGPDGVPLPGEYVAGWLKRGPTGVIGTNKADAAETVRALLADFAGGPGDGDASLPRPGLLRYPDAPGAPGAPDGADSPLAAVLAERGVQPVSYAEWLRIETAEAELAQSLGRGERVKLPGRDAIWSACRPGRAREGKSGNDWNMRSVVPEDALSAREIDTTVPHIARIYDFWLGGKDNFEVDREAGRRAAEANPAMYEGVRGNRAFLARSVRYLAGQAGVRQFLDLGTGIPAANNTHEVAHAFAPGSHVVYVDNDPIVLAHARALLTGVHGETAYLDADIRDTATVLETAARTLDFSQPIGLMMIAVLHCIPDEDDPWSLVRDLVAALPPGSYLALTHPGSDFHPETANAMLAQLNPMMPQKITFRTREQVRRFFDGLEFVEPGLIRAPEWHPDSAADAANPAEMWSGVARKP